ncbi:adenylosuccinate lyase [Mariniflexile sp.]|uniref:adenylosuccinate lyase n=1 Tax=Mariniflexile sp. TaxID=1979402 RepID=UPI00356AB007
MKINEFHQELSRITASREDRLKYANLVLNNMSLFPKLLEISFMVDDKTSCRAAWVFEFVCEKYIYAIIPYLDTFTENLKRLHLDSAIRPMAKVCWFLLNAYNSKEPNTLKKTLQPKHKERIVEACFDWLIGNQKIAAKVYAMDNLYILGLDYPWVHPQLIQILEQDFPTQSAGYKVRAKRILKKLKSASS